jgi:uncharacterized protein YbjQ (UPF0145 family)
MKTQEEARAEIGDVLNNMPWVWIDDYSAMSIWNMVVANGLQVVSVGVVGWLIATWFERRHFKSMAEREIPLQGISVNTSKRISSCEPEGVTLLIGSVVVAHDYFRTLIIFFRKVVGGNIKPYQRLVDRGRREALIRLKEEAELRGIDKIVNVRFTTSTVAGRFLHAIEMVAYGTGVKNGNVIPAQTGISIRLR